MSTFAKIPAILYTQSQFLRKKYAVFNSRITMERNDTGHYARYRRAIK